MLNRSLAVLPLVFCFLLLFSCGNDDDPVQDVVDPEEELLTENFLRYGDTQKPIQYLQRNGSFSSTLQNQFEPITDAFSSQGTDQDGFRWRIVTSYMRAINPGDSDAVFLSFNLPVGVHTLNPLPLDYEFEDVSVGFIDFLMEKYIGFNDGSSQAFYAVSGTLTVSRQGNMTTYEVSAVDEDGTTMEMHFEGDF